MAQLVLTKDGKRHSFPVEGKAALLDELSECGVPLNSSCRRGDCGQCAATPISGKFSALNDAMPWKQGAQILLCNSRAVGDASIELEYLPELVDIQHLRVPCKIAQLKNLSNDVLEVLLRLPPNSQFRFLPGQHIRITNRAKVTRSYSLAEPPSSDNLLRIHVRRVEGGAFSQYLFNQAAVNDLLHLEGPSGAFFPRRSFATKNLIFLATGTGIAPIYAMLLNFGADEMPPRKITLIWGNRTQQDAYLDDALKALQHRLSFHYICLYSRETASAGDPRHVQDLLTKRDLQNAVVLAAGAPEMVRDARSRCLSLGLPEAHFLADPFTSS